MKLGIIRLYMGESGKVGYYNIQELGLAKALLKKGIKTDIFFLRKSKDKKILINNICDGIRIIYMPAFKLGNHGIINPRFILDYDLDIIHLLSDNQIMAPNFIKFCNKNNIPIYNYIGTIYSDTNNKFKKSIMNFLVKRNVRYFKRSINVAKTIQVKNALENQGVEKVKLIPVGLDLDIIPDIKKSKNDLRKELNLPINKKILLFVGRFEKYKNPIKALEVLKILNEISFNYYLVMIGTGSMKEKVLNYVNEYKLNNNIIIIDKIENNKIHNYYKASDVFLNFNDKEIFGMSVLEAMYQECKVIAISAPGPNYIIDNNKDGVIMKNFDYNKWAIEIDKVSNGNKLKLNPRNKIINVFNWNSIAEEYINLFLEIKRK